MFLRKIFIDRDPGLFRHVLAFMRSMRFNLEEVLSSGVSLSALRDEAEYYGIASLVDKIGYHLNSQSDTGCGGILYSGSLNPGTNYMQT